MAITPRINSRKTPGVALLMSLSVIMLLSVALMKTFENRTVETVHLANSLQRFQAETLSRSIFRAILIAVKTKGLVFVKRNQSSWQGFPLPLADGQYFQIDEIKPLDHLFYLNPTIFRADGPDPIMFLNIINRLKRSKDPLFIDLEVDEIYPVLSAINDWVDTNSDQDEQFLYYNEDYYDMRPEFLVKNRGFDRISEIKILPPFQALGLTIKEVESSFQIFSLNQTINVNLATAEEMEAFLEQFQNVQFKGVKDQSTLFSYQSDIVGILTNRDDELNDDEGEMGFSDPEPRFGTEKLWKAALQAEGITLTSKEHGYFSPTTEHLAISFSVTVQRVTMVTKALVKVTYVNAQKSLDIKGFEILSFEFH